MKFKLHVKPVNPADELSFYVSTYLERDVRELENLRNLRTFSIFLRLAAGVVNLYEVKSGETFSSDWANTMVRLSSQFGSDVSRTVIYGGDESQSRSEFELKSWREFCKRDA